jgi:hypothetical protein
MHDQKGEIGFIIIPVICLRIIDDDGKKQYGAPNQAGDDGTGKFI